MVIRDKTKMNRKIIGILICTLFLTSIFSVGTVAKSVVSDKPQTKNIFLTENLEQLNPTALSLDSGDEWNKTFGGSSVEFGEFVQQTSDGGYIIVGTTGSFQDGEEDVLLIKTDENGNEQWKKTFGGPKNDYPSYHFTTCAQQTRDGGYIFTGATASSGSGFYDVWLVKTDSNGELEWSKTFGGSEYDLGSSVQQTSDGGYILSCYTRSFGSGGNDAWLIKTDSKGEIEWDKTYGGEKDDFSHRCIEVEDGYIVVGSDYQTNDAWIMKTDKLGDVEWKYNYGGSSLDWFYHIEQTNDGGYIASGCTTSFGAQHYDGYIVKIDEEGSPQWDLTLGGKNRDFAVPARQTSDGGYIIGGKTCSFGHGTESNEDGWIIKIDSNGKEQWSETFGTKKGDGFRFIQQVNDGKYVLVGYTYSYGAGESDIWLVKTGNPPNNPEKPDGASTGKIGEMLDFSTKTIDPDGDKVQYGWDWDGDQLVDEWTEFYDSGKEIEAAHSWDEMQVWEIRVKAKDEYGHESEWSGPLELSIPRNKPLIIPLFSRLFTSSLLQQFLNLKV